MMCGRFTVRNVLSIPGFIISFPMIISSAESGEINNKISRNLII